MPQQNHEESVFNMALAYLKRIDKLLTLCQHSAFTGNTEGWLNHLRGVYREASVRLKEDERKEITGKDQKINLKTLLDNNIQEKEATFKNINYLINDVRIKNQHKKTILFLLDSLEIKLRTKLQQKGMLLPSKQDPTKAVLNM